MVKPLDPEVGWIQPHVLQIPFALNYLKRASSSDCLSKSLWVDSLVLLHNLDGSLEAKQAKKLTHQFLYCSGSQKYGPWSSSLSCWCSSPDLPREQAFQGLLLQAKV